MVQPIAVFLGPSLPRSEAEQLLAADYYPPARHGDVYRLLTSGVQLIVLIDGVFHATPSVWQREVLAALDEGVRVIGAASMGALRAAELYPFGMLGCGTVFEWYRDGVIEADDEVALLHASAELNYRPLSEPLVNIRATLADAVHSGCVSRTVADALVQHVAGHHFSERSFERLWEADAFAALPAAQRQQLRARVDEHAVNIKAEDARRALARAPEQLTRPADTRRPRYDRSIWDPQRILGAGLWHGEHVVTLRQVVERAWQSPELWASALVGDAGNAVDAVRAVLSTRFFALSEARRRTIEPTDGEIEPFCRAFTGHWHIDPSPSHLAANGLTRRAYDEALRQRATFDCLAARAGNGDGSALVTEWGAEHGVLLPDVTAEEAASHIAQLGPVHFGYDWSLDAAFGRELQLTGLAGRIAAEMDDAP